MKPLLVLGQPRITPGGARTNVRLATGGSPVALGLGGFPWDAAIIRRPRMSIELLSPALDGRTMTGRADLVIALEAVDQHKDVQAYYWPGAPVVIYDASNLDFATMPVEFNGIVRQASHDLDTNQLTLNLEVSVQQIEKPVLYSSFTGGGGTTGMAEQIGSPKPAGFGANKNVEPVWIDSVRNIGMIDGYGNTLSIDALFEGGSAFGARVADYATFDALAAAIDSKAIAPGRWGTCVAQGLVGLGAPPVQPITVDAVFGSNRPGALINRLLTVHAGIAAGSIDTAALNALDVAVNRPVHYWTGAPREVKDLVEAIAASCNATMLLTFAGLYSVTRAFGGANIATVDRVKPGPLRWTKWRPLDADPPTWRMTARAARPGATLTTDQILYADDLIDRGLYLAASTYRQGHLVYNESNAQFVYTNAIPSAGNALPVAPATTNAYWEQTKPPTTSANLFYGDGTSIESLKPAQAGANVTQTNIAAGIAGQAATATNSNYSAITGVKPPEDAGSALALTKFGTGDFLVNGNRISKSNGDATWNGGVVGPGYLGNVYVEARFTGLVAGSKFGDISLDSSSEVGTGNVPVNTTPPTITAAPRATGVPVISGPAQEGQTLSSTNGSWTNSPTSFAYQWRRNGVAIAGATGSTYTLVAADVGSTIDLVVTATNASGSGTSTSAATAVVTAASGVAAPVFSTAPAITGTAQQGQTLTTTTGAASGSPSYAVQWKRGGVNIAGATALTYVLVAADVGTTITATSTATNAGGSATSTSAATAVVAPAAGLDYANYALADPFTLPEHWLGGTRYGATAGPELITNGDGSSATGWAGYSGGSVAASGGKLQVTVASFSGGAIQNITTVPGVAYSVSVELTAFSTTGARLAAFTSTLSANLGDSGYTPEEGVKTLEFVATTTTTSILLQGDAVGSFAADNISVRRAAGISQVPGYSSVRAGRVGFVNPDGSVKFYGPNVPAINGRGYHAYAGLTNMMAQSRNIMDTGAWIGASVAADSPTRASNTALAPDGTMTADTLTVPAVTAANAYSILYKDIALLAGQAYTTAIFVKGVVGGEKLTLTMNNGDGSQAFNTPITATTEWQRIVLTVTGTAETWYWGIGLDTKAQPSFARATPQSVYVWQRDFVQGDFPNGGPVIPTNTATAQVAEGALAHHAKADGSALTDVDQLFIARFVKRSNASGLQGVLQIDGGSDANRITLYLSGNNYLALVNAASATAYTIGMGGAVTGQETTFVLRRLSGAWRAGVVVAGVLTWLDAGAAGAFPTGLTTVRGAVASSSNVNSLNGEVKLWAIKAGAFSTDAAVVAAVQETA